MALHGGNLLRGGRGLVAPLVQLDGRVARPHQEARKVALAYRPPAAFEEERLVLSDRAA